MFSCSRFLEVTPLRAAERQEKGAPSLDSCNAVAAILCSLVVAATHTDVGYLYPYSRLLNSEVYALASHRGGRGSLHATANASEPPVA